MTITQQLDDKAFAMDNETIAMAITLCSDDDQTPLLSAAAQSETKCVANGADEGLSPGYVGLKNQGATCYLNSLLQMLYHLPYFRKAVYQMATNESDLPFASIPLALQLIFLKLQCHGCSVSTKDLTASFGWATYDSFVQHDPEEFNIKLCEKLKEKMNGTVVEGAIRHLFEGHTESFVECVNVQCKSTKKESFYDIQLDVKRCPDVYASFDRYVEVERLEGNNKYHAEQYGLQDAKKEVLFVTFPPVLQLHLKRFEYKTEDTTEKIHDRYEFPLQLDLDQGNGKYLSPNANRSVRNLYTLHSVLVHKGLYVNSGHYYAFIRPTLSDEWFKFDDERVTKVNQKTAVDDQFGGEQQIKFSSAGLEHSSTELASAYILMYIRESDKDKIICSVDEKDIPEHLTMRLKKEQEEKEQKKKEKEEADLYTIIKVSLDEDLTQQIGKHIHFDLVDHEKVSCFRIQKQKPFSTFKKEIATMYNIPEQFQSFWLWAKRDDHTYRPHRPLTPDEEMQTIGQLLEATNEADKTELKLFLAVECGEDLSYSAPSYQREEDLLLFFKLYDPETEQLRYLGRLFVKLAETPIEVLAKLNKMAGYTPDEEVDLYEEIKYEPNVMCALIDKNKTFEANWLRDGDIVCFQKPLAAENSEKFRYPTVPSFLEYIKNRQVVRFRLLDEPKKDEFHLELSRLHTYDDVIERVAQHIGLDDPAKIRLTSHNCFSLQPKPHAIKYREEGHLFDMLTHYKQVSDILYYEVLDIRLPDLESLKLLKVAFHHATKDEVSIHKITLSKQSTIAALLDNLKPKVELSDPEKELRLLTIINHRIYKVLLPTQKVEEIHDRWSISVEEIPENERNLGPKDRLIPVCHYAKETTPTRTYIHNFGNPFVFAIHEGETLAQIKVRIQKKLHIQDEEFAKWKFAFASLRCLEYLQDSDVLSNRFQLKAVDDDWEHYLGLEHSEQ